MATDLAIWKFQWFFFNFWALYALSQTWIWREVVLVGWAVMSSELHDWGGMSYHLRGWLEQEEINLRIPNENRHWCYRLSRPLNDLDRISASKYLRVGFMICLDRLITRKSWLTNYQTLIFTLPTSIHLVLAFTVCLSFRLETSMPGLLRLRASKR